MEFFDDNIKTKEELFKDITILDTYRFDEYLQYKNLKYKGWTIDKLAKLYNIDRTLNKLVIEKSIISNMFDINCLL
jgi:hypothetical protein